MKIYNYFILLLKDLWQNNNEINIKCFCPVFLKVSKAHFKILLDYLEDLKGASREQTLQEAKEFVENNEDTEGMYLSLIHI